MSPPTFILTIGDFGVTEEKFEQGFASCQQATEDQDGTAQLLYLACQTFMDLQFIQQFKHLFPCLLYTVESNPTFHCTELFTGLCFIDLNPITAYVLPRNY